MVGRNNTSMFEISFRNFCVRLICGVPIALHFMHSTESVFEGVSCQPTIWRLTLILMLHHVIVLFSSLFG